MLRKQTNAFAMHYGLIFGLIWCISLLFLVSDNTSLRTFSSPLFLLTPFIGFYIGYLFKIKVQYNGDVSYLRGLSFSLLLYLYATAVLAFAAYLYFQFFDHGAFARQNLEVLSQPEVQAIFKSQKMIDSGITIKELQTAIKSITPMTVTAAIININVLLSIPLALITAFFTITKKKTN